MAIQPSVRPAGSSHILRFQGTLVAGPKPQVENAVVPASAPPVANARTLVTFALADVTDLSNTQRRLPASVFDDFDPAQGVPHADVGGPSGDDGFNFEPLGKTWMQNVRVRAHEVGSTATPLIARIDVLNPGCSEGSTIVGGEDIPAVTIAFLFTDAGVIAIGDEGEPGDGVPIIVEIEIPFTPTR